MLAMLLMVLAVEIGNIQDEFSKFPTIAPGGAGTTNIGWTPILKPKEIKPGEKYPLVVFLHGAGERGSDGWAQTKYLPTWMARPEMRAKYPCFLIAPQCPANEKWVDVPWDSKTSQPMPKNPSPAMRNTMDLIDRVIQSEPINTKRIYLTGLSMGGYGVWDLAMRMPDRFAAIAPLCGGGDESKAALLIHVPILCYHGAIDPAVPVERSRRMIGAIRAVGGHPKYVELPGVGHDCWTTAYTDPGGVVPWMFEQKKK
jgi:predicted peptidase